MGSNQPVPVVKTDTETLRELSNLPPHACLEKIAAELRSRLECETACILLWHEVWAKNRLRRRVLVTEYSDGLPKKLLEEPDHEEIYDYGDGITGGYIFAQQNTIRATIDLERREVYDHIAGARVEVGGTKWHHMDRFGRASTFGFKSLLGLPLIVKNQNIGVVKLINKLQDGRVKESGFDDEDLERLKNFLSTIELVIETKTHEHQNESLFIISRRVTSADFNYDELLQETAKCCADTLNQQLCIIRMLDHKNLSIKGSSELNTQPFDTFDVSYLVLKTGKPIYFDGKSFRTLKSQSRTYVPSTTFNTQPPEIFNSEEFKIHSMLAVPVIYQEKPIGVIECYASLPSELSSGLVFDIEAYGILVATLFQRNRTKEAIDHLVESFSLLESSQKVYELVITSIEQYLDTKSIGIWEKHAKRKGFSFDLVKASESLEQSYHRHRIRSLDKKSLSARTANEKEILHLNEAQLNDATVQHRQFIRENNLRSLTIVPISFGGQAKAVINVFYGEDRELLKEDEYFLRLLAAKAAAAIWNKALMLSFDAIYEMLVTAPDVQAILESIANEARRVLYAEPVILYPFDPERQELMRPALAGENLKYPEKIYSGKEKRSDFVNLMLSENKPRYFESIESYRTFCQERGTLRPWTKHDFWHREKIKAMAAVTLFDKAATPVGVMFINYKIPFVFDDPTKSAIESFGTKAASAIVTGSFTGMRIQEMATEHITQNVLRELADFNYALSLKGADEDQLKQLNELQNKLKVALGRLDNKAPWEATMLRGVIEITLGAFAHRLETNQIKIRGNFRRNRLHLESDTRRIPGLFYAVLAILLDARSKTHIPGSMAINAKRVKDRITVELILSGGRVTNDELQTILHQPLFPPDKDNQSGSNRLELCNQLASSVAGQVDFSAFRNGVRAMVSLPIE